MNEFGRGTKALERSELSVENWLVENRIIGEKNAGAYWIFRSTRLPAES